MPVFVQNNQSASWTLSHTHRTDRQRVKNSLLNTWKWKSLSSATVEKFSSVDPSQGSRIKYGQAAGVVLRKAAVKRPELVRLTPTSCRDELSPCVARSEWDSGDCRRPAAMNAWMTDTMNAAFYSAAGLPISRKHGELNWCTGGGYWNQTVAARSLHYYGLTPYRAWIVVRDKCRQFVHIQWPSLVNSVEHDVTTVL